MLPFVSDLRLVRLFDFAENTLDLRYLVGLPDKILGRKSHWEGLECLGAAEAVAALSESRKAFEARAEGWGNGTI